MCSISRQNEARNSYGNISSDIHLWTESVVSSKHLKFKHLLQSNNTLKIRLSVENDNVTRSMRIIVQPNVGGEKSYIIRYLV